MKIKERRIWAFIIDAAFVSCISGLIQVIIPMVIESFGVSIESKQIVISISLSSVFYLGYFIAFDIWNNGVTIGKSAMAIQVMRDKSEPLNLDERLMRSLLKTIAIIVLPVSVFLYLWVNSFTVHDHFMVTRSIHEPI